MTENTCNFKADLLNIGKFDRAATVRERSDADYFETVDKPYQAHKLGKGYIQAEYFWMERREFYD